MLPGLPRSATRCGRNVQCRIAQTGERLHRSIRSIRVFGLGEQRRISPRREVEKSKPTIAPCPRLRNWRVTATSDTRQSAKMFLRSGRWRNPEALLGDDVYGVDDRLASSRLVGDGLREHKRHPRGGRKRTGGLCCPASADIPGASICLGGVCSLRRQCQGEGARREEGTLDDRRGISGKPQSRWLSALQICAWLRTSASGITRHCRPGWRHRGSRPVWSISVVWYDGKFFTRNAVLARPRPCHAGLLRRLVSSAATFF